MTTQLNLHRVFRAHESGFVNKIKPSQNDRNFLDICRSKIRKALTPPVKQFTQQYGATPNGITPKFRVQGSWAYGTCNSPAHKSQEIDLDYGIYLPVMVFGDLNNSKEAAKIYFNTVEYALKKLAQIEGWYFDNSKETCIRLRVRTNAHLDVPLYAVPDRMFSKLKENHDLILDSAGVALEHYRTSKNSGWVLVEEASIDLSEITTIHMAKRNGDWKASDCEQIRAWFKARLDEQPDNGRQLRYICRYLKAWRDYTWETGGPTSILIMVIAVNNYKYIEGRDDEALHYTCQHLEQALKGIVKDIRIKQHEEEDFNERFRNDGSAQVHAQAAKKLEENLDLALNSTNPTGALNHLSNRFGDRIPKDESLVSQEPSNNTNTAAQAAFSGAAVNFAKPSIIRPTEGG